MSKPKFRMKVIGVAGSDERGFAIYGVPDDPRNYSLGKECRLLRKGEEFARFQVYGFAKTEPSRDDLRIVSCRPGKIEGLEDIDAINRLAEKKKIFLEAV
ncbi:MAG: hypothetical protein L6R28_24295 [Planctomycetes bacterium]|nr:hypothetical protein [Planctomycetota bacterium]